MKNLSVVLTLTCLLFLASESRAVDFTGPPAGVLPEISSFFNGASWDGFVRPTAADTALFGQAAGPAPGGTHIVHFGDFQYLSGPGGVEDILIPGGLAQTQNAIVEDGSFQFDFDSFNVVDGQSGSYRITERLDIRDSSGPLAFPGQLTLQASGPSPTGDHLATKFLKVGNTPDNKSGTLKIDGARVSSISGAEFENAEVEIINGGRLTSGTGFTVASLSSSPGKQSTVTITGAESTWHNRATQFWVGHGPLGGSGSVTVRQGGQLRTDNAVLLGNSDFGGRGRLEVSGNGSLADIATMRIFGDSSVVLFSSGEITTELVDIGADPQANAKLNASFFAKLSITTDLHMSGFGARGGRSELQAVFSGKVEVGRDAFLREGSTVDVNTGSMTIGQAEHITDAINVGSGGRLFAGGLIRGNLINSGGTVHVGGEEGILATTNVKDADLSSGVLVMDILGGSTAPSMSINEIPTQASLRQVPSDVIIGDRGTLKLGGTLIINILGPADELPATVTLFEGFSEIVGQFDQIFSTSGQPLRFEQEGAELSIFAVPEPATITALLLFVGIAGLGRIRSARQVP